MVEGLARSGLSPVVVYQVGHPAVSREVPVFHAPELFEPSGASSSTVLDELLHRVKPNLIHFHNCGSPRVMKLAAQRLPTVATVHVHAPYCPGGTKVFWRTGKLCNRPMGLPC